MGEKLEVTLGGSDYSRSGSFPLFKLNSVQFAIDIIRGLNE